MTEVMALCVFDFWALLRDAIIYSHSQTDSGRKWLRNAHRMEQTAPDTVALHKKYG